MMSGMQSMLRKLVPRLVTSLHSNSGKDWKKQSNGIWIIKTGGSQLKMEVTEWFTNNSV